MSLLEMISTGRSEKVRVATGAAGLPTYAVPDDELAHGSSLGNAGTWLTTKATGAIEAVYSLSLGRNVFGACQIGFSGIDLRMVGPQRGRRVDLQRTASETQSCVELVPEAPGQFEIHPVLQKHSFTLPGDVWVEETLFLPVVGPESEVPTVCMAIRLHNRSDEPRRLRVYAFAELGGESEPGMVVGYDPALGALVATRDGQPDWSWLVAFDRSPSAFESTRDRDLVYEPYEKRPLANRIGAGRGPMAALQLDLELPAQGHDSFCWLLCFSDQGPARARDSLLRVRDWEKALQRSVDRCAELLSVSRVMVPEKVINEGVLWSKANMLRVMGRYPTGAGFTNDPGRSSNVVVRDVAWFVYGCDYLMPEYSAELLRNVARFQQESGKIVEFWDARTGHTEDYGLNINDDTPLFILAAGHHFLASHDEAFLRDIYPSVARAAEYLLTQKDDRGLIFCTSTDVDVRGICSWRNMIPGYNLSGAVTEVNSECYAALRMAAEMARVLGHDDDFGRFVDEAVGLSDAINTHLLNPDNGLYYLNIGPDGNPNSDVTCDEIFPVMFGASPPEAAFRIISRLTRRDFWTKAGLRTASSNSPEYTPDRDLGLRGGVWPGVTFWYAFAAARHYPEAMAGALASFQHYNEDPLQYNTVPGQFSEWFDGESLANRGVRLSPWEPPRLLWAAVEGMLGVVHSTEGCVVQPLVPDRWKWLAVRRLPHGGREETMFMARQNGRLHVYGSLEMLSSDLPHAEYDRDVSDLVKSLHQDVSVVALAREDELLICIGSSAEGTITAPVSLCGLLEGDLWYYIEIYDSELQDWVRGMMRPGQELERIAAPFEAKGFRLFRLTPVRVD